MCQERGLTWQPQVLVLGDSVTEPQQIFVICHSISYEVPNAMKAVDVCFKMFFAFNLAYPVEVEDVWEFLQLAVYSVHTKYDRPSPAVRELINMKQIFVSI